MLEDVLDACTAIPGWETWVVSPDEAALEIAARRSVRTIAEEKPPLSSAIRQVEGLAKELDADALAVLLADVALVTPESLSRALHTLGPVVMAPASADDGTNLLLRRPPRAVLARFGVHSFTKHLDAAASKELPVAIVEDPELAFDLDTARDLLTLLGSGREGRTRSCLLEMDAPARLANVS